MRVTSHKVLVEYPSFDQTVHGLCYLENNHLQAISLDAALPILHGKNGEDGSIQGTLELMGVPIIGCDLLSSALCMDKELAHRIVEMHGIKVAKSIAVKKDYSESIVKELALEIGYPLFVKPVRSGSSLGITLVSHEKELIPAIVEAFQYDFIVILEELIKGFEVGCAILGTNNLLVGEDDEIELSKGFFNDTEKLKMYQRG